jgi:hypothetical protein
MIPIRPICRYSFRMAASDSNAILPVRIGTVIAIISTAVIAFIEPISPAGITGSSSGITVWWFGVGLIASVSGILGLIFLERRSRRLGLSS